MTRRRQKPGQKGEKPRRPEEHDQSHRDEVQATKGPRDEAFTSYLDVCGGNMQRLQLASHPSLTDTSSHNSCRNPKPTQLTPNNQTQAKRTLSTDSTQPSRPQPLTNGGGSHNPFFQRFGAHPSHCDHYVHPPRGDSLSSKAPTPGPEEQTVTQEPALADPEPRDTHISTVASPSDDTGGAELQEEPSPTLEGSVFLTPAFSESFAQTWISFRNCENEKITPTSYRHAYVLHEEYDYTDDEYIEDYSRRQAGLPPLEKKPYCESGWEDEYVIRDKSDSKTFASHCTITREKPAGDFLKKPLGRESSGPFEPLRVVYTVKNRSVQTNRSIRADSTSTLRVKNPASFKPPACRDAETYDREYLWGGWGKDRAAVKALKLWLERFDCSSDEDECDEWDDHGYYVDDLEDACHEFDYEGLHGDDCY